MELSRIASDMSSSPSRTGARRRHVCEGTHLAAMRTRQWCALASGGKEYVVADGDVVEFRFKV